MLNLKLFGTDRVVKALSPENALRELQKALSRAAMLVTRSAKQNAGGAVLKRRTGDLATDVTSDVDKTALRAKIGTGLVYGPVHEYGATIKPLPPNKYLRFRVAPRGVNVTLGGIAQGSHPFVSVKQVVIPKRPWLMPAYESNRDRILDEFSSGLQRSLTP